MAGLVFASDSQRPRNCCFIVETTVHGYDPLNLASFPLLSRTIRCGQRRSTTIDHARLTHEIELFYYTKRNSQVATPIGRAIVASYREQDQMLIVTLPFCRPLARMWIHVEKVPSPRSLLISLCSPALMMPTLKNGIGGALSSLS